MKNNKFLYLLTTTLVFLLAACDPIVDEQHLSNLQTKEAVNVSATNTTPGGNEIKLELKTTGVTGYFDYITGKAMTNSQTIVFPVAGTFEFTYYGTLGAEIFEKKIPLTITTLDHPVQPEWSALLGSNPVAGKTWVFDGTAGSGKLWWFMSPNGDPSAAMTAWWNAGDCCGPDDQLGKMKFDLNGKLNYYYYASETATPVKGSYDLDIPNKKLTLFDAKILGFKKENSGNSYTIISLTPDKMVLYQDMTTDGTGWTYIFKPLE